MVFFLNDVNKDKSDDNYGDNKGGRIDANLSARLWSCIALAKRAHDLDIALTTLPKYQQHFVKKMLIKGDRLAITKLQGSSMADIGHGPMAIGA